MLFKSKGREKPRVFRGEIHAFKKDDWRSAWEQAVLVPESGLERHLEKHLSDFFAPIPEASGIRDPFPSDLAFDVYLTDCKTGLFVCGGVFPLALFWPPRIRLQARLYEMASKTTVAVFEAGGRPRLKEYVARILTFRSLLNIGRMFNEEDMKIILDRAIQRLLSDMARFIRKRA